MSLQDKYLPVYHFVETHLIDIRSDAETIYKAALTSDFSTSPVTKVLLSLRGISTQRSFGLDAAREVGFTLLEEVDGREIIFGLTGQFWKARGNIQYLSRHDFIKFNDENFAQATWNFSIVENSIDFCRLLTETRIYCPGKLTRMKFRFYWLFIKPFSGLIRMEMLKAIKSAAERAYIVHHKLGA